MPEFIDFNLDDIDDGFAPIPDGVNPGCVITRAEIKRKDGGEYEFIEIEMTPAPGQVEEKYAKKRLWKNLSFSPKAMWVMKAFFKATGMPMDLRGKRPKEVADALVGRGVRPTVVVKDGKNQCEPPFNPFQP